MENNAYAIVHTVNCAQSVSHNLRLSYEGDVQSWRSCGWNWEAGRVLGIIVKVHTKDVNHKGYLHHANVDDPQYEIKSDKTDHVALHKGSALRHLRR